MPVTVFAVLQNPLTSTRTSPLAIRCVNLASLTAVCAAAGVVSAQEGNPIAESRWRSPGEQRCAALTPADRLPALDAVLDTALAAGALGADSAGSGSYLILSVHPQGDGAGRPLRVLETDLAPPRAQRVATVLASSLLAEGLPSDQPIRIAAVLQRGVRFVVAAAEYCRPVRRPFQATQSTRVVVARVPASALPDLMSTARRGRGMRDVTRWEVVVDTGGNVVTASMVYSTRSAVPDEQLRQQVLRLRFLPALLERRPVAAVDTVETGDGRISGVTRMP